jgi:hypothetical protein
MANFQLQDTQKVPYCIFESDSDGNVGTPGAGDSAVVTTSDPASLTVAADAVVDPAKVPAGATAAQALQTGFLVGNKKAQAGVGATVTITHTDGTAAPPPFTDLLDIIVGPLTTTAMALGTPVSQ